MTDPILIAGGGIGGLSAAIAFARVGVPVHVLEQSETFSEAGAGIQVGPNALRILQDWGLGELIASYSAELLEIRIHDGLSGQILNTVPLAAESQRRYGIPYIVIRRAHLLRCLLEVVLSKADAKISTNFGLAGFRDSGATVEVHDKVNSKVRGQALVGADGLQSTVRRLLTDTEPETLGMSAWRTLVSASDAPELFSEPHMGVWMAPGCHLVHYPVDGGQTIDIVAITEDTYHYEGWGAPGDVEDLMPHFYDWDATPRGLVEQLPNWSKWTLFKMKPLETWGRKRVTLLGDAAHPVPPLLAQGSAMAIEDAAALAAELTLRPEDIAKALRRYEDARRVRTAKVQRASLALGRVYHYSGALRRARNAMIRRLAPSKLIDRYDWIYGSAILT